MPSTTYLVAFGTYSLKFGIVGTQRKPQDLHCIATKIGQGRASIPVREDSGLLFTVPDAVSGYHHDCVDS